jgi:hypothetical protein
MLSALRIDLDTGRGVERIRLARCNIEVVWDHFETFSARAASARDGWGSAISSKGSQQPPCEQHAGKTPVIETGTF